MEFPSLNTADGLKYLDSHLTSRSYISDCEPTQNDDTVFRALGHEPSEEFCNVLRWYRHIQSFGSHRKDLPKSSITLTIPSNSAESKGSGEEVEMKRFVNPSFLLHPLPTLCYKLRGFLSKRSCNDSISRQLFTEWAINYLFFRHTDHVSLAVLFKVFSGLNGFAQNLF